MSDIKKPIIPYSQLTDDVKIQKNWNKTIGLYSRGEYSGSVMRCCTCIELATNFAIRQEFAEYELPPSVVNQLLKNSNGIHHKYHKLYIPLIEKWDHYEEHKKLWKFIGKINEVRNKIVHGGEFKNKTTASKVIKGTYGVLTILLEYCEPQLHLGEVAAI